MNSIDNLLNGYQRFYHKYYVENPETYQNLVINGQSPHTLVIACSDSRVDPSIILNTQPGDIFVIRNVANLVPPFENDQINCHGTSAAIEYAVNGLGVENIIILGHSCCGGIHSLLSEKKEDHAFIGAWLSIAKEAKQIAETTTHNSEERHHCCEKEAIKVSLNNLMTFPFIAERVKHNKLKLFGWYFNLASGEIEKI